MRAPQLVRVNLFVEDGGAASGPHSQFFLQRNDALLILPQGRGSVPRQTMEAHQPPVGPLAGWLVPQDAGSVYQASFVLLLRLTILSEFVQHG